MDRTALDVEADVVDRDKAREGFRQALGTKQNIARHRARTRRISLF